MTGLELGKGKKAFFRVWLIVLIVMWIVAVLIAIFRHHG
jgi:flagellar basal body-associated protein FliL